MTAKYCKDCNRLEGFCICGADEDTSFANTLLSRTFEQMQLFEKRLDAQEELIANMMLAYSEMASGIEAVITGIMAPRSEEEKREFQAELKKRHLQLLNAMQEVTRGMERSGPDIGSALENLAGEDDTPPAEPQ